jgi:transposase
VSGVNDLTREELVEMVLKLHATVVEQEKQITELRALVQGQAERISELEEEVARLRGSRPGGISIKPSVKKKEKEPRKGRSQWFSRKKQPATKVICHAVEECPDCGRGLEGGSVKWSHQVVDIPPVRAEIVDHLFIERYCGVCGKRWTPDPKEALSGVVVGRKSFGLNLMSLVAHLKMVCRVPIGQIRKLLQVLFGVKISSGELAELLHDIAEIGEAEYDSLLGQVRGSPVVNADETGWREDGVNGYLWSFSTPTIRYYMYRKSRGSVIVTEALSEEFEGTLVTDFYAAYNVYIGEKQRCWVHLGRDLEALKEKNTDVPDVGVWVDSVMALYHQAKDTLTVDYSNRERSRLRLRFQGELLRLAEPYARDYTAPQRILAKRIVNFISELFVFVQYPSVPSENNAAERAIRPAVVARKISGGTRSGKGSKTMSILRSLFETWNAQGRNTIDACHDMLIGHNQQMLSTTK